MQSEMIKGSLGSPWRSQGLMQSPGAVAQETDRSYHSWWEHPYVGPIASMRSSWAVRLEWLNLIFGSVRWYKMLLSQRDFNLLKE